jgi:hypothetical protein
MNAPGACASLTSCFFGTKDRSVFNVDGDGKVTRTVADEGHR